MIGVNFDREVKEVKEVMARYQVIGGKFASRQVHIDGLALHPEPSQRIVNHSPDGFAWGYGGSGPAQLALALLHHFYDTNIAARYYQEFKTDIIEKLPQSDFMLTADTIYTWVASKTDTLGECDYCRLRIPSKLPNGKPCVKGVHYKQVLSIGDAEQWHLAHPLYEDCYHKAAADPKDKWYNDPARYAEDDNILLSEDTNYEA